VQKYVLWQGYKEHNAEVLQAPKTQLGGGLGGVLLYQRTAQTPQFRATGVISGASQHPKDVFCFS